MKRVVAIIMTFMLSILTIIPASAGEFENDKFQKKVLSPIVYQEKVLATQILEKSIDPIVKGNSKKFVNELLGFRQMNNKELNEYIDDTLRKYSRKSIYTLESVSNYTNNDCSINSLIPSVTELKLMWLAAAEIARNLGYQCSATLVECSVLGIPYNEDTGDGGLFHDKIITTNTYRKIDNLIKTNKVIYDMVYDEGCFERSDNSDLFYSIHLFDYLVTKHGYKKSISVVPLSA